MLQSSLVPAASRSNLDGIAEAYAAMDERRAIKSLVTVGAKETRR